MVFASSDYDEITPYYIGTGEVIGISVTSITWTQSWFQRESPDTIVQ